MEYKKILQLSLSITFLPIQFHITPISIFTFPQMHVQQIYLSDFNQFCWRVLAGLLTWTLTFSYSLRLLGYAVYPLIRLVSIVQQSYAMASKIKFECHQGREKVFVLLYLFWHSLTKIQRFVKIFGQKRYYVLFLKFQPIKKNLNTFKKQNLLFIT